MHAAVQVVDIGGLVEGASKGEGLGNRFLANIREVDAIVFVLRAFVDDDVTGPPDPLEHLRVLELELALADLETVEKRLHADAAPGQAGPLARRRARRAAGGVRRAGRWPPALSGRADGRAAGRRWRRTSCSPTAACWSSSTSGRTSSTRSPTPRRRVAAELTDAGRRGRGHRHVRAARGRGGDDRGPGRAGRDARGLRARRGRALPDGPQRLPPPRPADVPHDGRQGEPSVDVRARARRLRSAPGASTPTSSAASSGRRSSTGTSCSTSARGRRPRSSARSAWRARTTSSRTATWWSFASTSDSGSPTWRIRQPRARTVTVPSA